MCPRDFMAGVWFFAAWHSRFDPNSALEITVPLAGAEGKAYIATGKNVWCEIPTNFASTQSTRCSVRSAPRRAEVLYPQGWQADCSVSDKSIPQDLFVGGKYGKGYLSCRKKSGSGWSAPGTVRIEGGSVGFQIGGS